MTYTLASFTRCVQTWNCMTVDLVLPRLNLEQMLLASTGMSILIFRTWPSLCVVMPVRAVTVSQSLYCYLEPTKMISMPFLAAYLLNHACFVFGRPDWAPCLSLQKNVSQVAWNSGDVVAWVQLRLLVYCSFDLVQYAQGLRTITLHYIRM